MVHAQRKKLASTWIFLACQRFLPKACSSETHKHVAKYVGERMCRACFQDDPILLRLLDDKGTLIHIKGEDSAGFVIRTAELSRDGRVLRTGHGLRKSFSSAS